MKQLVARAVDGIGEISPDQWASLDDSDNPFLAHSFLAALEDSKSVATETGWQPHHLCLFDEQELIAFAPTYIKGHSHGEFVFDWAWADAYQRYGRPYYPKLLTAVPYSPIQGPRLLVKRGYSHADSIRKTLIEFALEVCERHELSTWHCNFVEPRECAELQRDELLARKDCQFHWNNPGYPSFDAFLAELKSKKRKNIRRDRRLVESAGIRFERREGSEINPEELRFLFACYQQTFLEHGNHPALNEAFFRQLIATMPQSVVVILAYREEQPIAMSFFLKGGGRLYGRYWGALENHSGLHFETAYHQGIEYCIDQGLEVFEPGAQGEHKINRGFEPVETRSFHHIRDPVFRDAIARFLDQETDWVDRYQDQLQNRSPFRADE